MKYLGFIHFPYITIITYLSYNIKKISVLMTVGLTKSGKMEEIRPSKNGSAMDLIA